MALTLDLLSGEFAIARLAPDAPVPEWAASSDFSSVTRTAHELSLVCPAAQVPADVKHERGWSLLRFEGPFAFTQTGVLASVLGPLAEARIGILAVSTFDTDYLLIKAVELKEAVAVLRDAGHTVRH